MDVTLVAMPDGALGLVDVLRIGAASVAISTIPGLAWIVAFWPPGSDISRLDRVAWIATLSYLLTGGLALALARLGVLRPETLALGLVALMVAGVGASAARVRGRGWRPTLGAMDRSRVAFVIAAVALPVVFLLLPQVRLVAPAGYPLGSITWYYWGLATAIVDSGAIPTMSAEWGGSYPYQGDYVLFSAFSAALALLAGRASDFALMEVLRLGSLLWAVAVGLSAFRRFLPSWGALAAVLIILGAEHIVAKYANYRPEAFNYALIFTAIWAVDRFRERPSRTRAIPIVATIVALWIGHGVVLVIAGIAAAAVVFGHWLVGQRPTIRVIAAFALVGLAGAAASIAADVVLQGKVFLIANAVDPVRIQGATSSDLTWQFLQWALGAARLQSGSPDEVETLWNDRILAPWPILETPAAWLVAIAVLAPLVLWRWLPRRSRALYAAGWLYLAGLLSVVLAFLWLYDTYVPQRVGFGRLAPFSLVGMGILVAVGLTAIGRWIDAVAPRTRRVPGAVSAGGWAVILVAAVVIAIGGVRAGTGPRVGDGITPDGYRAMVWLRDNTPPDSIVLANSYTEGAIGTLARRNGLLDGRAPYNKEFDFLVAAVDQLKAGRSFFAGETSVEAIRDMGVDYVVVSPKRFELANPMPFCDPPAELDRTLPCFATEPGARPGLSEVARFGEIAIYRVDPA